MMSSSRPASASTIPVQVRGATRSIRSAALSMATNKGTMERMREELPAVVLARPLMNETW